MRDRLAIENGIELPVAELGYGHWIILNNRVVRVLYSMKSPDTDVVVLDYEDYAGTDLVRDRAVLDRSARFTVLGFKLAT